MKRAQQTALAIAALASAHITNTNGIEVFELSNSLVDDKALTFPADATPSPYGPTKFGTHINGKTHQQWPIQTFKGYQYATYYDHNRNLCVARRKLPNSNWDVIRFTDYKIENNDSHNVTVIGIAEGDGSIHLAYDHHKSELNYRFTAPGVATNPESVTWDASLFSKNLSRLGPITSIEAKDDTIIDFTYPRFVPTPSGNLLLYFRYVTSGNGDSYLFEYDASTHDWREALGKFIARDKGTYTFDRNGDGQIASDRSETSPYRYAYINAISYAGNRLHVTWLWRDVFNGTSLDGNHDLCYAYSDDDGKTWYNNEGQLVSITGTDAKETLITIDTPDITVIPILPLRNAINQCTHYAFPDGTIHVMLRHYTEGTTTTRYHHYWRDNAGDWQTQVLDLSGSRPSLIGDSQKNLYLVYTAGGRTRIAHGKPNAEKTAWEWNSIFTQNEFTDGGDGVIDLSRWHSQGILSTYAQELNPTAEETPTPLRVIDYKFADGPFIEGSINPATKQFEISWLANDQILQRQSGSLAPDGWETIPDGTPNTLYLSLEDANVPAFYRLFSPPQPTVFKRFDWDDGEENMFTKDLDASITGGILTLTMNSDRQDPYIRMNDGSVNADNYFHIRVRARNQTSSTNWLLYFSPEGGGEAGNGVQMNPTANGDWQIFEIDMSSDPDWQGQINTIRIDFSNRIEGIVEIDYIEIYQ
ncbi:BNR repeat-containing protein [Pelagicoccus enzymogenes]|uniref:BNR repeat-containing protein n=1 Tax=Pelagicoccus enzymogenes TaxID=2773457 RepID=UPI00280F6177|nr:BNR repeat-containing protein [Pelagicoccus enzymogenes]MDQ8198596.1 BNR repeat-containing protein [Pelagicoccus enzymogenes]